MVGYLPRLKDRLSRLERDLTKEITKRDTKINIYKQEIDTLKQIIEIYQDYYDKLYPTKINETKC